jgi:hypothetical protein
MTTKEGDPDNLICGITIDLTPIYPSEKAKATCRDRLWDGKEINDKLRKIVEAAGSASMTRLIKEQFEFPSYLRVCVEATGDEWIDEGEAREVFSLDLDIYGEANLREKLIDIVGDIELAEAVCDDLEKHLVRFASAACPGAKLKWELEPSEFGEG